MKKTILSPLSATLPVALGLILFFSGDALRSASAQTQPLRTQITLNDGRRQIGVLKDSNEQGISFAIAAQPLSVPYANIMAIEFPDAGQFMQAPRAAYLSGDWEKAEAAMAQIADAFPQAAYVPNSFATEARYYQMDSLRRLGRYGDIGRLFVTPTGKGLTAALNDTFDQQVALLRLWAFYGAGNVEALETELKAYYKPSTGNSEMLPDAQFIDGTPEGDLAQLAFLRAKVHQANDRTPQALEDYYRTFTLSQGNHPLIAREAMTAVMKIQAAESGVADKQSTLWTLQSVAYVYANAFNQGNIDAELADYAVKPDLSSIMPAEEADEEKPVAPEPSTDPAPATDPAAAPDPAPAAPAKEAETAGAKEAPAAAEPK